MLCPRTLQPQHLGPLCTHHPLGLRGVFPRLTLPDIGAPWTGAGVVHAFGGPLAPWEK